jgi:sporulation protein YlmC with PRC-barrel domain
MIKPHTEKGLAMNGRAGRSRVAALALAGLVVVGSAGTLGAQVAGSTTIGVSVEELKVVAVGWSAKKKILGKAVYNDKNEKIGVVDDLIITPDKSVSYAIIGAGGFLGMGKHDVAVPVGQFKADKGRIVLAGATKDATYTNVTNFPRFLIEFSDWNLQPKLAASRFVFRKPADAKEIEFRSGAAQGTQ